MKSLKIKGQNNSYKIFPFFSHINKQQRFQHSSFPFSKTPFSYSNKRTFPFIKQKHFYSTQEEDDDLDIMPPPPPTPPPSSTSSSSPSSSATKRLTKLREELQQTEQTLTKIIERVEHFVTTNSNLGDKHNAKVHPLLPEKKEQLKKANSMLDSCTLLLELIDSDEANIYDTVKSELDAIYDDVTDANFLSFLKGEEDYGNAYINLSSNAGGDESTEWCAMLLRMYSRWADLHSFNLESVEQSETEFGLKNACVLIKGRYAYGWLKKETGIHRLVRVSPFDQKGKRHTTFASVSVYPASSSASNDIQISNSDLRIETKRASGPGGQHLNTTDSAVRITHLPTGIVVNANSRSQHQNRVLAMELLKGRLLEQQIQRKQEEKQSALSENFGKSWGAQIRNYVFNPYQTVVDLRSRHVSSNPDRILDGHIDEFLLSSLEALYK